MGHERAPPLRLGEALSLGQVLQEPDKYINKTTIIIITMILAKLPTTLFVMRLVETQMVSGRAGERHNWLVAQMISGTPV